MEMPCLQQLIFLGEDAVDVIEEMENCEAVFIKEDGERVCTGGVSEYGYVER